MHAIQFDGLDDVRPTTCYCHALTLSTLNCVDDLYGT